MRLIDADEAIINFGFEWDDICPTRDEVVSFLRKQKTIDAAPVVRGEWKLYGNDDDSGMSYWCTACNFQLSEDLFYSGYKNGRWVENGVFKCCPNCGAKMESEGGT